MTKNSLSSKNMKPLDPNLKEIQDENERIFKQALADNPNLKYEIISEKNFCNKMVNDNPYLKELYDKHVKYYDEINPNLFLGELSELLLNYASDLDKLFDTTKQEFVNKLTAYINNSYITENDDVKNLIAVSYVENITPRDAGYLQLKPFLSELIIKDIESPWT